MAIHPWHSCLFLKSVQVHKDPNGGTQGFGFVNYKNAEDAKMALDQLNGRFENLPAHYLCLLHAIVPVLQWPHFL